MRDSTNDTPNGQGDGTRDGARDGSGEAPPIFDDMAASNDGAAKRQRMWLYGAIGVGGALAAAAVLVSHNGPAATSAVAEPGAPGAVSSSGINTDQMTAQSLADSNYRAMNENRLDSVENQLRGTNGNAAEIARLNEQLQSAQAQRGYADSQGKPRPAGARAGPVSSAGAGTGDSRDSEIAALKAQIASLRNNRPTASDTRPTPSPGYAGRAAGFGPGGAGYANASAPVSGAGIGAGGGNVVKVDTYAASAGGKVAERANLIFADSINYLPPNSIANATVIVGADAQAGVRTQAEPIPVVLRITSNARSVAQEGRLLQTHVTGCLVNGAAYADLSSEKVFVKLQKMTCSDDRGGVAVSEVKGFVAFAGKAGVRGRVVSREGSFVLKSFLAGLVGGIGKLGQNVAQSQLYNTNSTNGARPPIDLATVGIGAGGSGVGAGSDAVSKYLIERAEQYQPVVEMPTGVSVEVVFLDGGYVR